MSVHTQHDMYYTLSMIELLALFEGQSHLLYSATRCRYLQLLQIDAATTFTNASGPTTPTLDLYH
jgi:hypothetical protein